MEDVQQILQENARLKEQILLQEKSLLLKDEQILFKDEQLQQKDEQLERKQQRILYLERQLYGRRSEKRLPSMNEAQLGLFDIMQGEPILEEETAEMT